MRLSGTLVGASILAVVLGLSFVVPPSGRGIQQVDHSRNPVYPEGSVLTVRWLIDDPVSPVNIVVFQLNDTDPQWMYVVNSAVNLTEFDWIVTTSENRSFSNIFYMAIYIRGSTEPSDTSRFFNISFKDFSPASTKSTAASSTVSLSLTSSATSGPKTSIPSPPGSSTQATSGSAMPSTSNSGMSTGAIVGVGVSVPLALIIGASVGFFLFRRRARSRNADPGSGAHQDGSNQAYMPVAEKSVHQPEEPVNEISTEREPVEMAGGPEGYYHQVKPSDETEGGVPHNEHHFHELDASDSHRQ